MCRIIWRAEHPKRKVIVQDNLESGASKEVIIKKLQKFVHIDREKAEQYYQQNLRELKG